MSNHTATIRFDGENLGTYNTNDIKTKLTSDNIKLQYNEVLKREIMSFIVDACNKLIERANKTTRKRVDEATTLVEAYRQAINDNKYEANSIGILSTQILDRLLKITDKDYGWWRVLEQQKDEVVLNNYAFVPKREARGKHGEGFLVERKDGNERLKPFKYSIRNKRYVRRMIGEIVEETIENQEFMRTVMKGAILLALTRR